MRRFGDEEGAVAVVDVARQMVAALRIVDADDDGAGESGAAQGEKELRHVVEQDADVKRSGRRATREKHLRPAAALAKELGVRQLKVVEAEERPLADHRIGSVAADEIGNRHACSVVASPIS